jgi:hypothetical protein
MDREDLLALTVATSIERCCVCGDPTSAVGAIIEAEKTKLLGLCSVCSYLMRNARSPSFFLVRRGNER